jgi:SAM-dependent methyltransferase
MAVNLGFHPLADTFLAEALQLGPEVSYPLQLGSCRTCGHVFTLYPVAPEDRYQKQDYSYDSSNSNVSIRHFREFAEAVLTYKTPSPQALVVDIGSNVGTLLGHFQTLGHPSVLGVEPSGNISRLAVEHGVPTLNDFFGEAIIDPIRAAGGVDILLSSNVINHVEDLPAILSVAKSLMNPDAIFAFEVPYLLDLVRQTAFDTIYHEHVHYYGIKPLAKCVQKAGFSVFAVDHLEYMCGSIRVYMKVGGEHAGIVQEMSDAEDAFKLYDIETYRSFMKRVLATKLTVTSQLTAIRRDGGEIIGIGAATKGNTFLNYCGLDSDTISYITDTSPLKIGKRTPGSHIPIISDADISPSATHALILPWNIADMLMAKLSHLGLEFYVPQVQTHPTATV